jgi:hypothetical protein
METTLKNIVIIYHQHCYDGMAGAWVARKVFGDTADYIPASDRVHPPEGLAGKTVYVIDYSYPKDVMLALEQEAAKLVVLDHHISARDAVESVREHVFDNDNSGGQIAWEYFFPGQPQPRLVSYIGDGDLWKHALPDAHDILSYIHSQPLTLESFDTLDGELTTDQGYKDARRIGGVLRENFLARARRIVEQSFPVVFEGHTVHAVNCPSELRSEAGHQLAEKFPPFGILFYLDAEAGKLPQWKVSLRGDGSIDCCELAAHYGGGGHKNAAAFTLAQDKLWEVLQIVR